MYLLLSKFRFLEFRLLLSRVAPYHVLQISWLTLIGRKLRLKKTKLNASSDTEHALSSKTYEFLLGYCWSIKFFY